MGALKSWKSLRETKKAAKTAPVYPGQPKSLERDRRKGRERLRQSEREMGAADRKLLLSLGDFSIN